MQILIWFLAGAVASAVVWWAGRGRAAAEGGVLRERLSARERELEIASETLRLRDSELKREAESTGALQQEVAKLGAQIDAAREVAKQRSEDEEALRNAFASLAAGALRENNLAFIDLAKEKLGEQQTEAKRLLEAKEDAIQRLLEPVRESLTKLHTHSEEMEKSRVGAYESVLAQIQNIQLSHAELRKETTQLVAALRAPQVRGSWGQAILEDCVKFAGMVQYVHFETEKFVRGDDASYRPDLVVKLPNGRVIIVDAKTPLEAFLEANAPDVDARVRAEKLRIHAMKVRAHLNDLSKKAYSKQFKESPDFVVCFLPSEVLFSAALEQDPSLIEFSSSSGVLLASPTTLITLLKAVAFGWQQSEIAENAKLIQEAALAAYGKLTGLYDDFMDLGRKLKLAAESYDSIIGKSEGRDGLFSIARKLKGIGIGEKELGDGKQLHPVAMVPRPMESEDWQPSLAFAANGQENT